MPIAEARLVGGPQDGARVRHGGGDLPLRLYVGPKWLGDGFAAWSREPSKRFPACYIYYGLKNGEQSFEFLQYQTEKTEQALPPEPQRG
jgi:hypothetical protein